METIDRKSIVFVGRNSIICWLRAKNRRQKLVFGGAKRFGSRHSDCLLRLAAARMESGTCIGIARRHFEPDRVGLRWLDLAATHRPLRCENRLEINNA